MAMKTRKRDIGDWRLDERRFAVIVYGIVPICRNAGGMQVPHCHAGPKERPGGVDALSEHRRGPHALTALLSVCLVRSARNRTSACIALLTLNQRAAFP